MSYFLTTQSLFDSAKNMNTKQTLYLIGEFKQVFPFSRRRCVSCVEHHLNMADGSVCAKDGTMVLAGGADKKPHLLHLATGQQAAIGSHDAPIRSVRFLDTTTLGASPPAHLFATGSWDKTVKYWDLRQQDPLATLKCADRVYAMDTKSSLLVIATAERKIHLVDLRNPSVFLRTSDSPLKHQTRAVSVFPDGRGWATTSIEGRCGINAVDEPRDGKRYCRIIFSLSPNVRTQTTGTRLLSLLSLLFVLFENLGS